jgi:hypothetical protein
LRRQKTRRGLEPALGRIDNQQHTEGREQQVGPDAELRGGKEIGPWGHPGNGELGMGRQPELQLRMGKPGRKRIHNQRSRRPEAWGRQVCISRVEEEQEPERTRSTGSPGSSVGK